MRIFLLLLALLVPNAHATDAPRTLRVAFSIAETSFDPAFASDAASDSVIANIFEAMLDYDYLARPVKLVPRTLEAMPTVEDGGRTYVCKVAQGHLLHARSRVQGQAARAHRRRLRLRLQAHPRSRGQKSPWAVAARRQDRRRRRGAAQRARKTGKFDYDAPIPGLEVVDRYTLRIRLKAPDLRFPYVLAVPNTARGGARGGRGATALDIGAHPVGTGPYMLGEYKRSARIVLVANPDYRDVDLRARRARFRRRRSRSPRR